MRGPPVLVDNGGHGIVNFPGDYLNAGLLEYPGR